MNSAGAELPPLQPLRLLALDGAHIPLRRERARVSAVVPTLGMSPLLGPCLEALRRQGGAALELVVVDQGALPSVLAAGLADRVLRPERNLGFAGGTNLGIAATQGDLVATVNDDVLIEPGWLDALGAALAAAPGAAAAQGANLRLDDPARTDGCGVAWNRWWQAVQIGHGGPAPDPATVPREVFGVSATAALYRRSALHAVSPGGGFFDRRLVSYYEDVELATRLRAAGYLALLVPRARARHAGSATGSRLAATRWRLLYGNRYLAAARLLGGSFWVELPRMAARDLGDAAHAARCGEGGRLAGIAAGWARAARHLPAYARSGAPAVPLAEAQDRLGAPGP